MELPEDIKASILLMNNTPIDDFLGLTSTEMHHLLYDTFGNKSSVQFSHELNDNTLDQIPLFRVAEEYLKIIQRDKQIKLTPLGALPKKVMVELYDKRFLLDDFIERGIVKLWREHDCIFISSARFAIQFAGLVKKANGKLTLTKKAAKLLETNNRVQLFKLFFEAFTTKFSWGYNDGYSEKTIGQLGWAFSIMLLNKFGNQQRAAIFYADKYLRTFPTFLSFFESSPFTTAEKQFARCYTVRTFDRFCVWFGFVTIYGKRDILNMDNCTVEPTDLLQRVFTIIDDQ